MSDTYCPSTPQLELLHQLFASATHDASAAMCRWTNGLITLSLDEVRQIPLDQVCQEMNVSDELLTMVVLSLEGELGGEMILTFDEENGRSLAASLLKSPLGVEEQWSELEKSALQETGNILGCAYMNALNRLLGVELVPSPPYFIQDFGASVMQQALLPQAAVTDQVLIGRTCFHRDGEDLKWSVFFIPTEAMRLRLESIST